MKIKFKRPGEDKPILESDSKEIPILLANDEIRIKHNNYLIVKRSFVIDENTMYIWVL